MTTRLESAAKPFAVRHFCGDIPRLILDSHVPEAFSPISHLTVGELREWMLDEETNDETLAAVAPGFTPEMLYRLGLILIVEDLPYSARFECPNGDATFSVTMIVTCPMKNTMNVRAHRERSDHRRWRPLGPGVVRKKSEWGASSSLVKNFRPCPSWTFMCLLVDGAGKASRHLIWTVHRVLLDFVRLTAHTCRSRSAVEAENLFLRKQLALFHERKLRPHRADDSTRWLMSFLSQWFDWRSALVVVKPDTLIRWNRRGFRLFWRWKSKPVGRPAVPKNLQGLIRKMAAENPTWGEKRIANELKLKLGIRVSPRTVQKYLRECPRRKPDPGQCWLTFVRNHARAIVACATFSWC